MSIETAAPPRETAVSTRVHRIPELDGLRGVAIMLVIAYHYFYQGRYFAFGWSGVDLFFVLSGFLIGGILLDVCASPRYFRTFYLRRLFRIVPIYYLWVGVYLLLTIFAGPFLKRHALGSTGPEVRLQVIALLLFVQNFGVRYSSPLAVAWFLPAWSLAVEEQFYLIAPLIIRLFSRASLYWLLAAVIGMAPILRVWIRYHLPVHPDSLSLAYTLMPCRADALAIGILTALLWRNPAFRIWLPSHKPALYALGGVLLAGILVLCTFSASPDALGMQSIGYSWIAAFYAIILLVALALPGGFIALIARTRWLGQVGRVSYCLYLIHDAVRSATGILFKAVFHNPHTWQIVAWNALAAVAAYGIANLSWTWFEYPFLRRGHEFKY